MDQQYCVDMVKQTFSFGTAGVQIVRYIVTVRGPGDNDKLQYEQEFRVADFGEDARVRAQMNYLRMQKLWPGYNVHIIKCPTEA